MRRYILPFLLASVALAPACTAPEALLPSPAYVAADRATYDTAAPILRSLADDDPTNDPDLTGANGVAVLRMVDAWDIRISSAEDQLFGGEDDE